MKSNNLGLHITKNLNSKNYHNANYIRFVVIDLNESEEYPLNFLCILPRYLGPKLKAISGFSKKFGAKSPKLAKELLTAALETVDDQEIRKEISKRLKLLTPKAKKIANCNSCGKAFEYKKYRYGRQKICVDCQNKICRHLN